MAKTTVTLKIKLPLNNQTLTKTMLLTQQHKLIASLFSDDFRLKYP
jgi:hypothetical protein